jgi:hypothetical protein
MIDNILVFIAMVGLIAFCAVVITFVAEPDLIIVTVLMLALASHDFWISVFKPHEPVPEEDLPLEALPAGVSGKPMPAKKNNPGKSAAKSGSRGKRGGKRKK